MPSRAALANGTFGLGFEFEDFHPWAGLHPGSFVVPAALATAEVEKAGGKALIGAVVAGHEVAPRLRMASNKTLEGQGVMVRGLYPQAIFGSFGAAAAAGVILGLDAERMAIAFGLAGEQAGGTMQSHKEGAWSRRMHSGTPLNVEFPPPISRRKDSWAQNRFSTASKTSIKLSLCKPMIRRNSFMVSANSGR